MYETITLEQLGNRGHNAHDGGVFPVTPDTFFAVQFWSETKNCFWTGYETTSQEEAEAELARMQKFGKGALRIVIVVAKEVSAESAHEEEASSKSTSTHQYSVREGDPADDWDANLRQHRAVRISDFRSDKLWAVLVEGNRRTGGRLSTRDIYDFATLEEAKASVAYHAGGWCAQATVYGHSGSGWLSWQGQQGCHYDRYDEYCKKWNAGAFDEAFERDYANDEAASHAR